MSFFCPKRFCLVTGSRCGLKRAENKEIRVRRATEDALLVGRNLIGEGGSASVVRPSESQYTRYEGAELNGPNNDYMI